MPTNEEYYDLWEASAPTPVDTKLTPEEIQNMQGTRNSDKPRWENYMEDTEVLSPELQKQIDEYSQRHHDSTSNQNLEELARWQEQNQEVAKEYQWLHPDEYKDEGARVGKPMHSSEFIKKLQSAGLHCWYRSHPQPRKITLVIQRETLPSEVGCWVQFGFMPELSIMRFDEHGVPLDEKFRGWRTCLLQLILKSAITEKIADEVFGRPKTTPAFHRYNSTLQSFRNAGGRLKEEK